MKRWIKASLALSAACLLAGASTASAWNYDQNFNKIDDRIEAVNTDGLAAGFEDGDITKRMTIGMFPSASPIEYAVYVGYDHHPNAADEAALAAAVGPTAPVKTYGAIDYTRTQANFANLQTVASLPGVTRVEAIPMMYALNHVGTRAVRARSSEGLQASQATALFPNAREHLGLDGDGVVVAIIDSGVNDTQHPSNPGYPGHEALLGKFLGGGNFYAGDPLLNTAANASENPHDLQSFHGSHVAGTAIGTGGLSGFFGGVAPEARLVDLKALSDAGVGFGSTDAIDWCITNKNNDWGLTGADLKFSGIDVLNLSLGCLDCDSDGSSAGELIVNAAVDAGLVVAIATGNDDKINSMGSPAGADKAISVGASGTYGTIAREDDLVTSFSNEGPRTSDGDADMFDEYKPNVVAPGAGIISVNGDWSTSGNAYISKSGTSMASPMVAGVAALLVQANELAGSPFTAEGFQNLLEDTALHGMGSEKGNRPADPFGIDQNYNPMSGWGIVDTYAAAKEIINNTSGVQVVRFLAEARPLDGEVDVRWWTQREYTHLGFTVERAVDNAGTPGTYSTVNAVPVAGTGDPTLFNDDNRTEYLYVDNDAALVLGDTYWYRVSWTDINGTTVEPAMAVTFGENPRVATLSYCIKHNTPDNDLFTKVGVARSYNTLAADIERIGEGTAGADSSVFDSDPTGTGEIGVVTAIDGHITWYWSTGYTVGDNVTQYLPPSQGNPWFVHVEDAGFVNRTGSIQSMSLFVNDSPGSSSGTTYLTDTLLPQPTLDQIAVPGYIASAWIPMEGTVPVAVLHMGVESSFDGINLSLELSERAYGVRARVGRSETEQFSGMRFVSDALPVEGNSFSFVDRQVEPGQRYWYWVEMEDENGQVYMNGPVMAKATDLATTTFLAPPSPNPVSQGTLFQWSIGRDVAGQGDVPVQLTRHDARGRVVKTLESGTMGVGRYSVQWDRSDDSGRSVAQGVYFFRFNAGMMTRTAKVLVVD